MKHSGENRIKIVVKDSLQDSLTPFLLLIGIREFDKEFYVWDNHIPISSFFNLNFFKTL